MVRNHLLCNHCRKYLAIISASTRLRRGPHAHASPAIAVLGYTVGIKVLLLKGYEKEIALTGAVRASIRQPQVLPPLSSLSYCEQPTSSSLLGGVPTLPCVYPDFSSGTLSRLTPGEEGALLVGTRVSRVLQTRANCTASDYTCAPWEDAGPKESSYVGGLEACTVMVQHMVSPCASPLAGAPPAPWPAQLRLLALW